MGLRIDFYGAAASSPPCLKTLCCLQIRSRLGANLAILQLPIGSEENFRGVVDLLNMRALIWANRVRHGAKKGGGTRVMHA